MTRSVPLLRAGEAVLWALVLLAVLHFLPGYYALASQIAITALFVVSLDLLIGYAGVLSLGHAAFFGIGAYAAGILARSGWGEPVSGLLLAGLAAGVLGYLTSFMVIRVRHLSQLMVTLGVGVLLYEAASRLTGVTGGDDGLQGIDMWPLLGLFGFDMYGRTAFLYAAAVLAVCFAVFTRIVQSPFGLALQGLRENPRRMAALGTAEAVRLRTASVMAAVLAGIAGGLLAQTTQFVALEVLSFHRSAEVMIMLVLGGAGYRYGGLFGAALFMVAHDELADFSPQFWMFALGAAMVVFVLVMPGGLLGGLSRLRGRLLPRGAA
jgi:branched-chain amino acid transport system permease protein